MAIQFAVASSNVQQHEDQQSCRRGGERTESARNPICSTVAPRSIQSRGASHGPADANDLVVALLPLVRRVALQLRGHLPAHVELDDLVSEGAVGLIDAVRKFDPGRGVTLDSYARYRIRGAILDSLRDQDPASRDMRRRIKKIESVCHKLESRLGRRAGDAEMAEAMGLGLAEWHDKIGELQRLGFEAPSLRISQRVSKRVKEDDLPAPSDDDAFTLCYRREQRELFARALGRLTERERSIINFYYQDALTMKQIGQRLGIDESRVSQLHAGAVERLRSRVADTLHRVARISGRTLGRGTAAAQVRAEAGGRTSRADCPRRRVLIGDVI